MTPIHYGVWIKLDRYAEVHEDDMTQESIDVVFLPEDIKYEMTAEEHAIELATKKFLESYALQVGDKIVIAGAKKKA
ncbi:hypothetical protein D3C87_766320 [compost metagenome]